MQTAAAVQLQTVEMLIQNSLILVLTFVGIMRYSTNQGKYNTITTMSIVIPVSIAYSTCYILSGVPIRVCL